MRRHLRLLLCPGFLSAVMVNSPCLLAADDPADSTCISGEYIITTTPSMVSKKRAEYALEQASDSEFDIQAASEYAVLLRDSDKRGKPQSLVHHSLVSDACWKLRQARRKTLREARASGENVLARNYSCSCNALVKALGMPNDPYFGYEWGLHQGNDVDIDAPEAWELFTGSQDVVIAVIDTGVDYSHEDLVDNMWHNPEEIPNNGLDDDANGYVDDVHGINAITGSGSPYDDHGHGTHVAGTIGANCNNGIGVCGVNWRLKIMGAKFLSSSGSGSSYNAIVAIDYVTNMKKRGINVVLSNNSWGGGGYLQPLYDAIVRAHQAKVLFVAAAGNSHYNTDSTPHYPANYGVENVISVAAVDSNGNLASFSNYGAQTVDIAAPGVSIASTYPANRYVYMSGTSMAAPHVSGALALAAGHAPNLSHIELRDLLYAQAQQFSTLVGLVVGARFLNVNNMIRNVVVGPTPTPTIAPTATPTVPPTPTMTPTPTATPTSTPTPKPGPYNVSGRVMVVINNQASPAPGALIRLVGPAGTWTRVTNSSGRYDFGPIIANPGTIEVSVSLSGYEFAPKSQYIQDDVVLDFSAVGQTFKVAGLVIDGKKQPLGGITVDAGALGVTTTNSQGRFSFDASYNSSYSFTLSAPGYIFDQTTRSGLVYGDVTRVFVGSIQ